MKLFIPGMASLFEQGNVCCGQWDMLSRTFCAVGCCRCLCYLVGFGHNGIVSFFVEQGRAFGCWFPPKDPIPVPNQRGNVRNAPTCSPKWHVWLVVQHVLTCTVPEAFYFFALDPKVVSALWRTLLQLFSFYCDWA